MGWTLSAAYDVNPVPRAGKDGCLSTAIHIDQGTTASIELAIDAAEEFLLTRDEAKAIAGEVAKSIAPWRVAAAKVRISAAEAERMESAFEHQEANLARRWAGV